eukprot:g10388.t1
MREAMDRYERNRAKEREQAKAGRERMSELRVFRDIYHPFMRPSDVPFIEIISGRMSEVYNAVKDFRRYFLPLIIAIKFSLAELDVDPRIRFIFSIPGTFTVSLVLIIALAALEYLVFLYMVIKGKSRKAVQNDTCAICLTKIKRNTENSDAETVELHCRHSFHKKCIVKWLKYRKNCPLCRSPI